MRYRDMASMMLWSEEHFTDACLSARHILQSKGYWAPLPASWWFCRKRSQYCR